jgi:MFS family permease
VRIFRIRAFSSENLVLLIAMMTFIPIFFFASEYAQISLNDSANKAGIFLLFFFLGFVVASQIGGRILDREGAKRSVVLGCAIAAGGFGLWASKVTTLHFADQRWWIIVAGAGMGLMLGPANTDAVNRASTLSYGEATGITQTIRNYGASLGLAILGTILLSVQRSQLTASLRKLYPNLQDPAQVAASRSQSQAGTSTMRIPPYFRMDFAHAIEVVLFVMCGIMALAAVVAFVGLQRGLQEMPPEPGEDGRPPESSADPALSAEPA